MILTLKVVPPSRDWNFFTADQIRVGVHQQFSLKAVGSANKLNTPITLGDYSTAFPTVIRSVYKTVFPWKYDKKSNFLLEQRKN